MRARAVTKVAIACGLAWAALAGSVAPAAAETVPGLPFGGADGGVTLGFDPFAPAVAHPEAVPLEQLALSELYVVPADLDTASRLAADTLRAAREARDAAARARAVAQGQTTVGPDGCPVDAPPGTLRQGAERPGIHAICVASVADARTPEAARAVKFALAHVGAPYDNSHRRNDPGRFDCSSFVSRAYRDGAGLPTHPEGTNAPTTATLRAARWTTPVSLAEVRAGDLVFPHPGHVGMVLADGWMVHTNRTGDVAHVRRLYTEVYTALAVLPDALR